MCRHSPKVLVGVHKTESKIMFVPAHCGTWDCADCAPIMRKRHQARIINATWALPGQWCFITVTAHRKWRGFEKSLANLEANSRKLMERIRRKYGTVHYCVIHEPHKDGSLHFHALFNTAIDERWLKDASAACGMGHQCKSEVLRDPKSAGKYVGKYLAKAVGEDDVEDDETDDDVATRGRIRKRLPKRFKRVRYSQGFPDLTGHPDESEFKWSGLAWPDAPAAISNAKLAFKEVVNLVEVGKFT